MQATIPSAEARSFPMWCGMYFNMHFSMFWNFALRGASYRISSSMPLQRAASTVASCDVKCSAFFLRFGQLTC